MEEERKNNIYIGKNNFQDNDVFYGDKKNENGEDFFEDGTEEFNKHIEEETQKYAKIFEKINGNRRMKKLLRNEIKKNLNFLTEKTK